VNKNSKVAIIDMGIGNSISIANALYRLGTEFELFNRKFPSNLYSHIILPGVGSFDAGMKQLRQRELDLPINEFISSGKPILGICLGMQLLFSESEEGVEQGIGFFPGKISKLKSSESIRVPNTSWQYVRSIRSSKILNRGQNCRLYHNHSFAYQDASQTFVSSILLAEPEVVVAVEQDMVFGVQFHPEKSHSAGDMILQRFVDLN